MGGGAVALPGWMLPGCGGWGDDGDIEPTPQFRSDLYQGTAPYYDRYRVPYPALLVHDLVTRAALSGTGRLLDLACGPGRVTFALSGYFADVLAIDQEEESVNYAKTVAAKRGAAHVNWRTGRAEDLEVAGDFELVTVGDAFHRLDRRRIAALANQWLQPSGHIALLWTSMPWQGPAAWQKAALELVVHWMQVTGSLENIPSDLEGALTKEPNLAVLANAGLTVVGTFEFTAPHVWALETLAGFAHSTSILSRSALGNHVEAFEHDLRDRLLAIQPDGNFEERVSFTYDLAVKP
ncbi:MAG TPA: class I SAM-dependent methyltransferase [Acidimicrobiales bacterium]|nr:class I SAM-dependent methyltransferase [Acidimicrobiales bacterium]